MGSLTAGETHVDNGTITVPYAAGVLSGLVSLSAAYTAAAGTAAQTARPYVTVEKDAVLPASTVVAALVLATPTLSATSTAGAVSQNTVSVPFSIYPNVDGSTFLQLHFNGATAASAVLTGG